MELKPDQLRWRCPELPSFDETKPAEGTVGQDRALKALKLGLELRSPGYNVFVAGFPGTGRTTTVRRLLESLAPSACPAPRDRAYVHNFRDPDRPRLLEFAAGRAARFKQEMDRLVDALKRDVARLLDDEAIKRERAALEQTFRENFARLIGNFEEKVKAEGFGLTQVKAGGIAVPDIVPIVQGKAVPLSKLDEILGPQEAARIASRYEALRDEFETILKRMTTITKEVGDKVTEIERRAVSKVLKLMLSDIRTRYPDAAEYLDAMGESVIEDLEAFKGAGEEPRERTELNQVISQLATMAPADAFVKYRVNVILDSSGQKGCPMVFEDVPSESNLIGTIEVHFQRGSAARASFTDIKAGSLLRADGGYLVVQALDLLRSPGAWAALKRVLKTGKLEISIPESPLHPGATTMKPEPIEVNVKVVMIGEPDLYDLLWHLEEDFSKIFKVKADFDSEMKLSRETMAHYAAVLSKICRSESLLPFDRDGLAAIIEEGVRRAGRQGRITTRFSEVADIAREATYWARESSAKRITSAHVRRALDEQIARHQRIEEKIQELIDDGIIRIDVAGARVGQVNGLAVYDAGVYAFGKPSRITASVSLGRAGLINIEREAGLSGRTHDKGVLIISGLMRERYAQDFPLSLSASLAFEQSYSGVDGDSASSTEIYALLSAISGVAIRQSVAVTGSVDQKGGVQAIGGVNQKIEGFFTVCKAKGLTDEQGVMIPASNVRDLMLRDEVVEAVVKGRFHVWSVETIDQGIEILTGTPAAAIHERVSKRLREFAETLARFERSSSG